MSAPTTKRAERGGDKKSHRATSLAPTLADLGIEKMAAKRWQDLAQLAGKTSILVTQAKSVLTLALDAASGTAKTEAYQVVLRLLDEAEAAAEEVDDRMMRGVQ